MLRFIVLPRASVARLARGPTVKITNASPTLWKKQCREESTQLKTNWSRSYWIWSKLKHQCVSPWITYTQVKQLELCSTFEALYQGLLDLENPRERPRALYFLQKGRTNSKMQHYIAPHYPMIRCNSPDSTIFIRAWLNKSLKKMCIFHYWLIHHRHFPSKAFPSKAFCITDMENSENLSKKKLNWFFLACDNFPVWSITRYMSPKRRALGKSKGIVEVVHRETRVS